MSASTRHGPYRSRRIPQRFAVSSRPTDSRAHHEPGRLFAGIEPAPGHLQPPPAPCHASGPGSHPRRDIQSAGHHHTQGVVQSARVRVLLHAGRRWRGTRAAPSRAAAATTTPHQRGHATMRCRLTRTCPDIPRACYDLVHPYDAWTAEPPRHSPLAQPAPPPRPTLASGPRLHTRGGEPRCRERGGSDSPHPLAALQLRSHRTGIYALPTHPDTLRPLPPHPPPLVPRPCFLSSLYSPS